MAEYLISKDLDIENVDENGWTPLMEYFRTGYYYSAKVLLSHDARTSTVDYEGLDLRDIAKKYNKPEMLELL
ncbi:hypothetical protein CHISP_3499 [Chitinispirillum alkaliphilum]|nr:hypothetical protein CHISP_3499 [Chitinispirillum alkaliphilum]